MLVKKEIFRAYDIRGIYNEEMDDNTAYLIGRAFGTRLREKNILKTVVAYDNRLSSVALEKSMVKGLMECGIHVIRLGLATTPMCYFASNHLKTNSSMMITASHNPKEYNGFKFSYNGVYNASGDDVVDLYYLIQSGKFIDGEGSCENYDISNEYIDLIVNSLDFGNKKIKVVYDPGNGTGSIIAGRIFERLKDHIDSVGICDKSDGTFPLHHPDPCVEENLDMLKEAVNKNNADVGLGFDGDADRFGCVAEDGTFIPCDTYMIIMWKYLSDKVSKKECMYDVKCSKALYDELIKVGVKPVEFRVGNSYTRKESARGDYPLSGELSGHIYFRDKFPGYDDGIYVGLRLVEMLSHTGNKLSDYLDDIVKYYSTPELKYKVTDENKFEIVDKIKEYCISKNYNILTIDGVKAIFDDGFALVRASNTGPNITSRFEAKTDERLKEIQSEFESELNKYMGLLK